MRNTRTFVLQVDSVQTCFLEFLSLGDTLIEVNVDSGATDVKMSYRSNGIFIRTGRYFSLSGTLQDFTQEDVILAVKFTIHQATMGFYPAGLEPAIARPDENGKVVTWYRTSRGIEQSTTYDLAIDSQALDSNLSVKY